MGYVETGHDEARLIVDVCKARGARVYDAWTYYVWPCDVCGGDEMEDGIEKAIDVRAYTGNPAHACVQVCWQCLEDMGHTSSRMN